MEDGGGGGVPVDINTIQLLPQARHLMPTVSQWLLSEWPDWYGEDGPGDLSADVTAFAASEHTLPIGFVAFDGGIPVGFGALKADSIPCHKHLTPWAAAGFVLPDRRGQGIGAFLLRAIVDHAKTMGYEHVYCGTSTSISLLHRAGWHVIEKIVHAGEPMVIFRSGA